eukprot:8262124-Alexandrium_andersonii.AAC.1
MDGPRATPRLTAGGCQAPPTNCHPTRKLPCCKVAAALPLWPARNTTSMFPRWSARPSTAQCATCAMASALQQCIALL